jgi:VRR-NUC domain
VIASVGQAAVSPVRLPMPLAPGYYLENFEAMLAEVEHRYGDLLRHGEREFLWAFRALGLDSRRLYVRLLSRRGPWFRVDRLRYTEIAAGAERDLVTAGFAEFASAEETTARLALLVRNELLALVADLRPADDREFSRRCRALPRSALGEAVAGELGSAGAAALAQRCSIVRLLEVESVLVFRALFFGNLAQDWTEFVLADLGVVRFEPVPLDAQGRPFADRAALDCYLELRQQETEVGRCLAAGHVAVAAGMAAAVSRIGGEGPARRVRDRILVAVARALERSGDAQDLEGALELYASAWWPPARERRARVLRRLGRVDEAVALSAEMATAPQHESERIFAARDRGGRRLRRPAIVERSVLASRGSSVEEAALMALAGEGYRGFFGENWLWRSLFGLAFWDIVFAPVRGAFTHRFQYGPHDLHDGFRPARESAVAARLAELCSERALARRLLPVWDEKFGVANRLVTFLPELRPRLELALAATDGRQLAAVADRLSRDLRRYGSGFPDLFLVDPAGGLLLAEVKGPGDQLRPEQEGWLEYLDAHGLPAVVLRLRWR